MPSFLSQVVLHYCRTSLLQLLVQSFKFYYLVLFLKLSIRNDIIILSAFALAFIPFVFSSRALAQRVVPRIGSICPLGYVDKFNGKCTTFGLPKFTVRPTYGRAYLSGWMNVGGGHCRRNW